MDTGAMKPHIQLLLQLYSMGIRPYRVVRDWGVGKGTAYKYYQIWWTTKAQKNICKERGSLTVKQRQYTQEG